MSITFAQSQDEIAALVKHFRTNFNAYHAPGYKEAHARQEFINPLFIALGWDVYNTQRATPQYREVVLEDSLDVEGQTKAPDYTFRVGKDPVFFVEAKRPGIVLKTAMDAAYQVRRYAWSAKLPLSILTDFEEFAVYDCRARPAHQDKATVARTNYYTFEEYADRWRDIWDVFAREAVLTGSFNQYAEATKGKRGTTTVDAEFLKEIEHWRDDLAHNFALRNPRLSIDELNDVVQRTIDRIIFLRMAEDRGVEPYERLKQLTVKTSEVLPGTPEAKRSGVETSEVYARLIDLARKADTRYNSGLFDFSEKGDQLSPTLALDDKILKHIILDLYYPNPYEFKYIPVEILGNVYEQFLGKVIRLTPSHQAKVEEKPEVKKAGGVYYTPSYIVEYIVKHTVGKWIGDHVGANDRAPLPPTFRVLDMACGSGSFLLGAYQYLLDYYLKWYVEHEDLSGGAKSSVVKRGAVLHLTGPGEWRLTIAEKKRILTAHIFGVDIDRQAAEVTKLSLLLKVLEGESDESLQMRLFDEAAERALPNLDDNIKCGNSLIDPDYFADQLLLDEAEMRRVNPFDWQSEFPDAMCAGGFDCIIGNPPYVRQEGLTAIKPYLEARYKTFQATADLYVYFIERGHQLLKPTGLFGMIISNKWLRAAYGRPLREFLTNEVSLHQVIDFAGLPVFANATVRTLVIVSSPQPKQGTTFKYLAPIPVEEFNKICNGDDVQRFVDRRSVELSIVGPNLDGWSFIGDVAQGIIEKMQKSSATLNEYIQGKPYFGVKTGFNQAFIIDRQTRDRLIARSQKYAEIIKPVLGGRDVRRYSAEFDEKYLIWTYVGVPIDRYPAVLDHLKRYQAQLQKRWDKGENWWELRACDYYDRFSGPKIIYPDIATNCRFVLDRTGYFGMNTTYFIPGEDLYLLGVLNSKLGYFYFSTVCAGLEGGGTTYLRFFGQYIEKFPVHRINSSADKAAHDRIVTLVDTMLQLHPRLAAAKTAHDRDMIQRQIDATDRQIDALVYELYGLTEDEIKIVEGR